MLKHLRNLLLSRLARIVALSLCAGILAWLSIGAAIAVLIGWIAVLEILQVSQLIDEHLDLSKFEDPTPLGYALAMRVLQSDLYHKLNDEERAECDEFIHRGMK